MNIFDVRNGIYNYQVMSFATFLCLELFTVTIEIMVFIAFYDESQKSKSNIVCLVIIANIFSALLGVVVYAFLL